MRAGGKRIKLIGGAMFASSALLAFNSALAAGPDLSGAWAGRNALAFRKPPSGPGPIGDLEGFSHFPPGTSEDDRRINSNPWVGNYKDPILTPWAADILKKTAEDAIRGTRPFAAREHCYPGGIQAAFWPFPLSPMYFVETPKQVLIIYSQDHEVRRVYLNQPHSQKPKPSWYGESVGHYEADALIVDTIGFNDRTLIDHYGTPHSELLHVVERYRVMPGGQLLEVTLTFEDQKAFTVSWSGAVRFSRAATPYMEEQVCAAGAENPITRERLQVPTAITPDF